MNQLFNHLEQIRFWRKFRRSFPAAAGGLLLGEFLLFLELKFPCLPPTLAPDLTLALGGGALLIAAAGLLCRRRLAATAAELDRELGSANELEAAVESANGDSMLRNAQREAAERLWRRAGRAPRTRFLWPVWLAGVLLLLLLLLLAVLYRLQCERLQPPPSDGPAAVAEAAEQEKPQDQPPPPAIEAKLEFTYPEEDPGLTPIDLAEWEGCGVSGPRFAKVELVLLRNGSVHRREPAEPTAPPEKGRIYLAGAVPLDSLDSAPRDLIGLQLEGTLTGGESVLSAPIFFLLKPLREEIVIVNVPPAYTELIDLLNAFLRRQVALNKLSVLGRNTLKLDPMPDFEAFGLLAGEQRKLADELAEFLEREKNRTDSAAPLTPAMVIALTSAVENMKSATAALAKPDDAAMPDAALAAQMRAIADLAAAMREVRKAVNKNREQTNSSKPKEKEEKRPNPAALLEKAIQVENDVLRKTTQPELPKETGPLQSGVSAVLQLLKERSELPDAFTQCCERALAPSRKAEEAIVSNAPVALASHAAETLKWMKEALEKLTAERRNAMNGTLSQARSKLSRAEREAASRPPDSVTSKPEQTATEVTGDLGKAADAEEREGLRKNADALKKLAEKLAQDSKKLPGQSSREATATLGKMRGEIGKLQRDGKQPGAEALAGELGKLRRELDYHRKHGDWKESGESFRHALELALEGVEGFWREQPRGPLKEASEERVIPLQKKLHVTDFELDPSLSDLAAVADGLEALIGALNMAADARELPTAIHQFTPDRIPEEYRELAARYFEALSRLRSDNAKPQEAKK